MDTPVWQKFDAAAADYDEVSILQQQSAHYLLSLMSGVRPNSVWLDAGCGTGVLAKALAGQGARVWAIDQAANMLKFLEDDDRIQTIQADIQQLPLPDEMLDGVVSNFVLHWLGAPILQEMIRVIQPNGEAWLAIPVEGSLRELQQRFAGFPLFPFQNSQEWITQAGETLQSYHLQQFSKTYPDLKALLAALRQMGGDQTGAAPVRPQLSLWREWLADSQPIDLSFQVLFLHLKIPARHDGLAFLYQD
jgi:ubiquinone/menaquinone biosynthesis C-methylase UbiE